MLHRKARRSASRVAPPFRLVCGRHPNKHRMRHARFSAIGYFNHHVKENLDLLHRPIVIDAMLQQPRGTSAASPDIGSTVQKQ